MKKGRETETLLPTEDDSEASPREIYVEFEINTVAANDCPLDEFGSEVEETRQQMINGECHTDIRVSDDSCDDSSENCPEVIHTVSDIEDSCICSVFEDFGLIPNVTAITDRRVRIETYLPDRTQLTDLVDELKSISNGLYLRRLESANLKGGRDRAEFANVPLDRLTEKQRRAAVKAVSAGYYARPRETSLAELADDLGISKSACSQRLRAVESKLALSAFEGKDE